MARTTGSGIRALGMCALLLFAAGAGFRAEAQAAAGYSEYIIPGNEGATTGDSKTVGLWYALDQLDTTATPSTATMHSVITVTAWAPSTTIYYDHWEDGLDFDPNSPSTADETVTLATTGAVRTFESTGFAIPVAARTPGTGCNGGGCFYDGGDRIVVAGGAVTVTRAGWIESRGVGNQAVAWEIYPVKPQLTTYVLPFGENLGVPAFQRVFALVQATADGTTFQVDVNGDGTFDVLNANRNATKGDGIDSATINLDAGQTFLLDAISACPAGVNCTTTPGTAPNQLRTGVVIQGSSTLQVKFVAGITTANYGTRGLSAFPRGYWTKEYYAPLDQRTTTNGSGTDYFLHNPHATALTVNWESRTTSGSFSIPANSAVSYNAVAGPDVPVDSGLYFSASDVFWGVGVGDTAGSAYEWGFSLLPATFLSSEHLLGWAPGSSTLAAGTYAYDGAFLVAAQDNTRVFVDYDNDGTADQTYDLDRLQTQYIYDSTDGNLTGVRIWATGPFTLAYGENADTATTSDPALDLGYVAIPGTDFISLVLDVEKTAEPQVVPSTVGSTTTFTLDVRTSEYSLDGVSVHDLMPPGWAYVPGSVVIRPPDQTEITGAAANPVVLPHYADLFGAAAYTNNDSTPTGTVWTTPWREEGEANGVGTDNVRVLTDMGVTPNVIALRFRNSGATNGRALARMADLSLFEAGTLRFRYRRQATDGAADRLDVQVCANAVNATPITCPAGWASAPAITGFAGTDAAYLDYSVDLGTVLPGSFDSASFALRFSTLSGSSLGVDDFIWIDDVRIEPPGTFKWPASTLGSMAPNQLLQIEFDAVTTVALPIGTLSQNRVLATGSRTVGSPAVTQTFSATDFAYVATGSLEIANTSNAPSPLYPGNTFTYTVTVTNPAGGVPQTQLSLGDTQPAGVAVVAGTPTLSHSTVADAFDTAAYGNNQGSRSWSANWAESDAGGGGAGGGFISLTGGQLRLNNDSGVATQSTSRGVNLTGSGATQATLAFDYATSDNLENADVITVQYQLGGGGWTTLGTFTNDGAGTAAYSFALASPANLTEIRFAILATGSYTGGTEYFYVDNLSLTFDQTFSTTAPPELLPSTYFYALAGGESLTATFDVTVDNPFPTGSNILTNVAAATSAQLPMQITASVDDQVTVPTLLSATVAGRVWFDGDADGAQDVGEPGISNVQVTLKDRFGTPVATLTTDVNGRYLFTGVTPGTGYYVEVTGGLPSNLDQTYPSPALYPNRTAAFDLSEGENHTGADLGYATEAGTVSFGDTAWVDADADGARDAGEVGLGGVVVTLYRDANGDGLLQVGTDTLVGTATTASDGSYLFAGQTAGATYFVSAATPSGYTRTNPTVFRFQGTVAGTSYLTADFGYAGTTYTISDRVWFDTGNFGVYDVGENGIAGVTVEILDASLNVIGVTTTDANGVFSFSGLAGSGADYATRISDTGGVLSNFTGTTSYALARQRAESNLAADRDRTAAPSYGFNATRSIGDTVFFDLDGDGVQDAGENGIGGIVVGLYSDGNANGIVDGTDALLGSVTTDAAGHYLFSGLTNGSYTVSVPPLTGYTFTGPGTDSDGTPANGTQKGATINGTANVLNVDFGFQANTPRSASGTFWNDADRDGVVDSGEARLPGVTVEIRDASNTVLGVTTTDASGNYSFTGLASGSYTLRVTDTAGVLSGYFPTYERTGGTGGPFDDLEVLDLTGGNLTGVNFGYGQPTPTYVSVSWLKASVGGGTVTVEWHTSQEVGTVGFDLYRLDPATATWTKVNEELLPSLAGAPQGGTYGFQDGTAPLVPPLTYKLVETDAWGVRHEYGPWELTKLGSAPPAADRFQRTPEPIAPVELSRLSKAKKEKLAASAVGGRASARVKVRTKGAGLRFLDLSTLSTLLGEKQATLAGRIAGGRIGLENRGKLVPYLPAAGGAGLYFHAEEIESPYTLENVYWVGGQKGYVMESSVAAPTGGSAAESFVDTARFEVDRYPLPALFQDPAADFWGWEDVYAGLTGLDTKSLPATLKGVAGTGAPVLTVRLQGASSTSAALDHHVRISWNGKVVGEAEWDGPAPHVAVVPLAPGDLVEGANTLTLTAIRNPGVSVGLFYLDSFEVAYDRLYEAADDELAFTLPAGGEAAVRGFTTAGVVVLDVTTPSAPSVVSGATSFVAGDGTQGLRLANRGAETRSYLAVSPARAKAPVGMAGVGASTLRSASNAADYLLVVPTYLTAAAKNLATYRQSQGLDTMVVALEEVWNEFGSGLTTPVAVRDFVAHALAEWRRAPRFLTLVGRGTWDYKDLQGVGDNVMPPFLAGTPYGLAASDAAFAELGPGGLEGIGRLPVLTGQELLDYVAKVQAQEAAPAAAWQKSLLFVADNPDSGGAFPTDSDAVAALAGSGYEVKKVYLPAYNATTARTAIVDALNAGALVFNYVGHGAPGRLADENVFTTANVPSLANAGRLPLFLAMTCSVGNFAIPGYPSLSEALVLSKSGGAYAAWAPSGLSLNEGARTLNQEFVRSALVDGEKLVGKSAAKALGELPAEGATTYLKGIYNVIGEPVSRLP